MTKPKDIKIDEMDYIFAYLAIPMILVMSYSDLNNGWFYLTWFAIGVRSEYYIKAYVTPAVIVKNYLSDKIMSWVYNEPD